MATNIAVFNPRLSERKLLLATAIGFPLVVLVGYARTYYFSAFFDVPAVANRLVHTHGVIMSAWVLYFVMQTVFIRTRNIKLHMTMGMIGVALAALVIVVGLLTAYDAQLVRHAAPPGADPHAFFLLPVSDMVIFAALFSAAIYYRKKATEHKCLMFLTAIAFMPAALFRLPVAPPQYAELWAFGVPGLIALGALAWHWYKTGKLNRPFAIGTALIVVMIPLRPVVAHSNAWLSFVAWLVPSAG
ncbi:hypothetical protein [Leptolyngbya sp. 7M]|uniref:hypothetical protein n=1 Tax=Leptolyngbya sp. 7M TaxID=2812896 RepID=UPI001B8C1DD5|nr:hypothetical protein [Leptolyngbya sp. 7M]QYO66447.1 hypothetical protein JVX88_06500 [Leptolyngbya sp. 7M]